MRKYLLAGAAALALFGAGLAIGQQQITSQTLTGNEVIVAAIGGPGGPSLFVPTAQLRNALGATLSNGAANIALTALTANLILTAQPAAITITLPPTPFDGQTFEVINGTTGAFAVNVVTLQPAAGQTLIGGNIALTTLAAGASRELRYALSTNTWYPMR